MKQQAKQVMLGVNHSAVSKEMERLCKEIYQLKQTNRALCAKLLEVRK
jgi:hypothetical protein